MKEVFDNLKAIDAWTETIPVSSTFQNNNDFMNFIVELMSRILYILKVGVSIAPTEQIAQYGYSKQRCLIPGHMSRITKLYEGVLMHISERQLELAMVFSRLIFETAIRIKYLITSPHKRKSFRSFLLASYKPEKEMLADSEMKVKKRPLIPIEKRMRKRMRELLKRDHISLTTLKANTIWNIDGKNFKDLLRDLKRDMIYSYLYGAGSHAIHGDWHNIHQYHLQQTGRYYAPKLEYTDPDPRIACSLSEICLQTLLMYLKWNKSDSDNVISPVVLKLLNINRTVAIAHENMLNTEGS